MLKRDKLKEGFKVQYSENMAYRGKNKSMILWAPSERIVTTELAVVVGLSRKVLLSIKRGNRWSFSLDDPVELANVTGTELILSGFSPEFNKGFAHLWAFLRSYLIIMCYKYSRRGLKKKDK